MLQRSTLSLSQGITHTVQHIGQAIVRANNRVLSSIAQAFQSVINAISSVFRSIIKSVTSAFQSIIKSVTEAFRSIIKSVTEAFRSITNSITGVFRSITNSITSAFRSIINSITRTGKAIVHGVARTWGKTGRAVASAYQAVVGTLSYRFGAVRRAILGKVRDGVDGIHRLFRRLRGNLDRMVSRLGPTTLTLSVEDGVARAVAFKGRNVVAWTSTSLGESPEQGEEISQPQADDAGETLAEETPSLKTVLKQMSLGRTRLVTDMPMYAPLIRQLHLPKVAGRYRQQMILSEVLETIPFEPEEVDVSWQLRQNSEGEEAFAIAVPKGYVDSQVQIIKDADLSPSAAYTKATALAFAIGLPDAIVVLLAQDRVATVLVHESTPRVVHQQEFPWKTTNPQEQADAVAVAVDQVAGYYQGRGPGSEEEPLPVVLTGQVSDADRVLEILPQVLRRPVLPFAPAVGYPDDFPQDAYAANLGLFLADQARTKRWGKSNRATGPALDVLPQRYRPRPLPVLPIGVFTALFPLVGLAVVITGPVNDEVGDSDQLSLRRDNAQNEERAELATQVERLGRQGALDDARLQARESESGLGQLKSNMESLLNGLVAITGGTSPFGVELSSVAPNEEGFAMSGTAVSYNAVFAYAGHLRASDLFEEVSILQLSGSGGGTVAFSLVASVPQPVEEEEDEDEEQQP